MKQLIAMIATLFGISTVAHAGILIEPYLGYEFGDMNRKQISQPEYTDKGSGTAMGLRLGYKFLIPWVALDYTTGSGKVKSGESGQEDSDYKRSSLGAVAGVNLPLIRGWVGYGFQNNLTNTDSTGDSKFKGTYTKFGVGLGFIPFVSINAEYQINNYEKFEILGQEYNVKDQFDTFKNNTVMLSVSLPLNL